MAVATALLNAFNRGRVSRLALARTDLKRTGLSAQTMTNWMCRSLGSMMLRPGLGYIGSTKSNLTARNIPFIFSATDTAWLELTDATLRPWVAEAPIVRPAVSAVVTNGTFDTDLSSWTDADDLGCASIWVSGGLMQLLGDGTGYARRQQGIAIAEIGVEHALRIVIAGGPVTLKVGTSAGVDDYIAETTLRTGTHSLALTPTGTFFVEFSSNVDRAVFIDACTVEAAGAVELPTPWAASDLPNVRWDQSADVIFVACAGRQPRRIERRAARSWSIATYDSDDGPFTLPNIGPATLTPSAISGDIAIAASQPVFRPGHVGALFRITSTGQTVSGAISSGDTFTNPIRVTGVGADRTFTINVQGTWVGSVKLERSIDSESGPWSTVSGKSWTANTTETYADGLDNQIVWYRIGIIVGEYGSGTANVSLSIAVGSITGIVRITGYASSTSVGAAVLTPLGGTAATSAWDEGLWSEQRGWPTSVALYEGRLWWFGKDNIVGSVSDAFDSFSPDVEGDSGPIVRTIGQGPVDTIAWALGMQRLLLGCEMAEKSCRSTSFDEPLTPTNFNLKDASTQGSAKIAALKIDSRGVYVQKSGRRVFLLEFDLTTNDYASADATILCPDLGIEAAFVSLAVQRQPDTRIHAVRADGTVAVLVFDPAEDVKAWVVVATDGVVEDAFVLPGDIEDAVYYVVARTVNGATVRYVEKWAREDQCRGQPGARLADAYRHYSGAAATTIGNLDHLEGRTVVCWGWNTAAPFTDANGNPVGRDFGTLTVSGGQVTLTAAVTDAVVGLPYTAQFKSAKLAYAAQIGSALTQRKRITQLGLVLADVHWQGLQFGQGFGHLDDLPQVEDGVPTAADTVWSELDTGNLALQGSWDTDARLCLQAAAPRPCTALGCVITVATNERP